MIINDKLFVKNKSSVINPELRLMFLLVKGLKNRSITLWNKLDQLLSVVEMNIELFKLLEQVSQLFIFISSIFLGEGKLDIKIVLLLTITLCCFFELQSQDPLDSSNFSSVGLRQISEFLC